MPKIVVALYRDINTAEAVVRELVDNGFRREDIGLVAQDRQGTGTEFERSSEEGGSHAGTGAGAGAVLGGLAGLVVGLGALAIPGLGPIIAAGPLATTLAGAGIGAVAGGLIGALTSSGVPEQDAKAFTEGVRQGGTLVTIRAAQDQVDHAANIMNGHHPLDINEQTRQFAGSAASTTAGTSDYASTGIGSHYHGVPPEEAGMAQPEPIDPGVDYRGVPGDDAGMAQPEVDEATERLHALPPNEAGMAQPERTDADTGSHGVPREEAGMAQPGWSDYDASQREMMGREPAEGRAAREYSQAEGPNPDSGRPDLSREGERQMTAGAGETRGGQGDFASFEDDFRQHYDLVYGTRGQDYRFYQPAYRYGYDLAGMDKYRGRRWNEIEPEAQQEWEHTPTAQSWESIREAVRHGWERAAGMRDAGAPQGGGDVSLGRSGEDYSSGESRYTDPKDR